VVLDGFMDVDSGHEIHLLEVFTVVDFLDSLEFSESLHQGAEFGVLGDQVSVDLGKEGETLEKEEINIGEFSVHELSTVLLELVQFGHAVLGQQLVLVF